MSASDSFLPQAMAANVVVGATRSSRSDLFDQVGCAHQLASAQPSPAASFSLPPIYGRSACRITNSEQAGAIKEVSLEDSKFLVPWSIVRNPEGEGEKCRLIADCRQINRCMETKHFRLEHWQKIFPALRKGMYACKVDLKHAYFHLGLAPELRPYVRINVGDRIFEFQAACFGLNQLPQLGMSVMKVFQKMWRQRVSFASFIWTTSWKWERPFTKLK